MLACVEDQVLVDLVADGIAVESLQQPAERRELVAAEDLARGVHRRVEQNALGLVAECGLQRVPGDLPVGRLQAHQPRRGAGTPYHRQVAVVEGLEQHDLVTGLHQREDARRQGLGSPRADHDLALPVGLEAIEAPIVVGHGPAQLRHAHHRRVLVGEASGGVVEGLEHGHGPFLVGEPLAEIDGLMLDGEPRHDLEDGRAERRKGAVERLHGPVPRAGSMMGAARARAGRMAEIVGPRRVRPPPGRCRSPRRRPACGQRWDRSTRERRARRPPACRARRSEGRPVCLGQPSVLRKLFDFESF